MSEFSGFKKGCPGSFRNSPPMHSGIEAHFESAGRRVEPRDAGHVEPDAIRVGWQDDYESSMYKDMLLAFDPEAIVRGNTDSRIPKQSVRYLDTDSLRVLSRTCIDCAETAPDECPTLELLAAMEDSVKPILVLAASRK